MEFVTIFVLILIVIGLAILCSKLWKDTKESARKSRAASKLNSQLSAQNRELTESNRAFHEDNERLRPYAQLADADDYAKRRQAEGDAYAAQRQAESDDYVARKKAEADAALLARKGEAAEIVADAKAEAKKIRERQKEREEEADKILAVAQNQATRAIEEARKKAEEIAGKAYFAMENAERLEATASAMKDLIEGYGDKYLINSESWVDALAENWDHMEAGRELKASRRKTAQMIEQNLAAQCNYSDPKRRETARRFVIDAFNGKVDSILAKARHSNYTTLAKQIRDSFQVVNHNGVAFRETRITDEYLGSRVWELYWLVGTKALEKRHREEQTEIKRQIREEERARREYEKAIKEAEKEEALLEKAREQARAELQKASDAERAKYEAQLADIEGKLKEAEEKNQRAISMAQQTKRGHVYIISNVGSFGEDTYKIGMTRRLEPLDRVKELGDASVPFSFDVHAMIYSEDAPALESKLHKVFEAVRVNKVNHRKEFFRTTLIQIKEVIGSKEVEEVHWTMEAEAQEYRETRAIEAKGSESGAAA